jgi:hypothetical protein
MTDAERAGLLDRIDRANNMTLDLVQQLGDLIEECTEVSREIERIIKTTYRDTGELAATRKRLRAAIIKARGDFPT